MFTSSDEKVRSQLHRAAEIGNLEDVEILLEKDPKGIYNKDNRGKYPIHDAAAGVGTWKLSKCY